MLALRSRKGMLALLLLLAAALAFRVAWEWALPHSLSPGSTSNSPPSDDSAAELPLDPTPIPSADPAAWKHRRDFLAALPAKLSPVQALGAAQQARLIGDYEAARTVLEQGLQNTPSDPLLLIDLADTDRGLLREDEARALYLKTQQIGPPHAETYIGLTQLAMAGKNRDEAWKWMRSGMADAKKSAPTEDNFVLLGRAYADLNDFEDAQAALELALQAAPGDVQAQIQMASLLLRFGRIPEARSLLEQALQQHPDSGGICRLLATAVTNAADPHPDYPRARVLLEKAAELTPLDVEVYRAAATVYRHQNLNRLAAQSYDAVLRLDPTSVDARYGLGQLYEVLGKPDLARTQLALSALLRGREQQVKAMTDAIRDAPRDPQNHFNLARLYEGFGQYPGAVQQYQIAASLDPHNPVYRSSLDRLYRSLGWK